MSGKPNLDVGGDAPNSTPQVLHLKQLKLPTSLREYDTTACECGRDGVDHPSHLLHLVGLQLIDRACG